MSGAEAPRYSDGRLMHLAAGMPITDEHREIVRKYLGTGPGEVVTAEMVNRAITFDRHGAVPYDEIATAPMHDDLPPTEAADVAAERAAFRERLAEREAVGARFTMAELNRPIRQAVFDQTKVLDPAPAERLQDTVEDVRHRRTGGITIPVRVEPDEDSQRLLGTAVRRDALHAAATVYQGRAHDVGTETILLAADDFAAWLRDERQPESVDLYGSAPWLPTGDPAPPLTEGAGTAVIKVAGYTFDQLRALDIERAERLAVQLDAALAEDRVDRDHRPLVRTALAILRRQR